MNIKNTVTRRAGLALAAVVIAGGGIVAGTTEASAAPPMPSGYYRGDVTTFPAGNAVWYGKSFTGGSVINNTAVGWAFPGKVYPGRSVQNGESVIVVDYSGTAVGFVRDELRSDGRGGYWGRSLNGTAELLRFHLTR